MGAIRAGAIYFLIVFAIGFVLGSARVLLLEPRIGALAAVAIELPVMLAAAWIVCGGILRRSQVRARRGADLGMGAVALLLLLAAEFALGHFGFGRDMTALFAAYGTSPGLLGLAGQIGFAAIPAVRCRWLSSRGHP
ncbi:hypothetical protein [Kaistia sp. MMO-174]|uniref:hypothetical protein n=1 Tax=Kaistia sp. MMO-174 TaxID=3081256 RepID=UPI001ACA3630|nr:hypothetical protein [Hyphomicrobiales bacterium]MBN9057603.1 hypothetical protein [Hyphomicrobiales bacterium]